MVVVVVMLGGGGVWYGLFKWLYSDLKLLTFTIISFEYIADITEGYT